MKKEMIIMKNHNVEIWVDEIMRTTLQGWSDVINTNPTSGERVERWMRAFTVKDQMK